MKPYLELVFQKEPSTSRPWRLLETYLTSEGPRSRIVSGTWATEEEAREEMKRKDKIING